MDQELDRNGNEDPPRGVIWITGYSSAGKTSLARIVSRRLEHSGRPSLFLDGDDLRGILGHAWGYTDEERRELARVYFRLCSYIASQQAVTIVIAAAAMYSEVYEWFRDNVPGGMIVYLNVPEEVRRRRDTGTKGVYAAAPKNIARYDVPSTPDLTVDNPDGSDLHASAGDVIAKYLAMPYEGTDRGKSAYWDSFYAEGVGVLDPSPFSVATRELLGNHTAPALLEVGCGNGRDAAYFAREGFKVTALDTSAAAIAFCTEMHKNGVDFVHGALKDTTVRPSSFDAVYSRFVLHAMTLDEEETFLTAAASTLKPSGHLLVECRSILDPLAREGKVLSPTERIHGHYRRFIVADELVERVKAVGLTIESMFEASGLAVFGDEDPVVIRLIATKPH